MQIYKALGCPGSVQGGLFVHQRASKGRSLTRQYHSLGFTSISMYPKLFEASGIPFEALVDRLLQLAMEDA